jgi:hypothetical protein
VNARIRRVSRPEIEVVAAFMRSHRPIDASWMNARPLAATPRGLFGSLGLMVAHRWSMSFVAHDWGSGFEA